MAGNVIPFRIFENLQRYPSNRRAFVEHHTASKTLRYRQTGSLHTNLGASGAVTLTLPQNADKGVEFNFAVLASQTLNVDPGSAGAIYFAGSKLADSTDLSSATIGDALTVVCDGNNDWAVTGVSGSWGQSMAIQDDLDVVGDLTATRITDDRFDPATRVWAMSTFNNRLYTKAVISDWTSFKSVGSANLDWVVSGSATAYGGTAGTSGAAVLSGSNSSAYAFIKPRTGGPFDKIKWITSKSPEFDFVIKTGTLLDANIAVGLFSATYPRGNAIGKASSGSNRIEVYIDQNGTSRAGTGSGGSWKVGVAGSGASSPAVATGTNANSSTVYHVRIKVNSSRIVTVFINDMATAVYTSTLALTTAKALVPMIAIQSEGAKRNMEIVHVMGSQSFS